MLHNTEITGLMTSISLKLTCSSIESYPELWTIYDLLQTWKINVEWDHPEIGTNSVLESAAHILEKLVTLSDHSLAQTIEEIVIKNTLLSTTCTTVSQWREVMGNSHAGR